MVQNIATGSILSLTKVVGVDASGFGGLKNVSDFATSAQGLKADGSLQIANNLSDVASPSTSLANLGGAPLASPTFTGTVTIPPGAVINGYAPLASPSFGGTPTAPTQSAGNNSTALATTAYADRMLPLAGGTMTGSINMNGFGLTNLASITLSGSTLPLTGLSLAQGDMLYASASNVINRLAKGTALQILRMNSGNTSPEWVTPTSITLGTSSTASGTTINFTPPFASPKRIVVMFKGVSTSGTNNIILQIGTGGVATTTGYVCGYTVITATTAAAGVGASSSFQIANPSAATATFHGTVTLSLLDSSTNTWVINSFLFDTTATRQNMAQGTVAISGILNIVSLTTSGGTDTFDAGTVNISYEY